MTGSPQLCQALLWLLCSTSMRTSEHRCRLTHTHTQALHITTNMNMQFLKLRLVYFKALYDNVCMMTLLPASSPEQHLTPIHPAPRGPHGGQDASALWQE